MSNTHTERQILDALNVRYSPAPVDEGGMTLDQCIAAYRFQVSMFPITEAIKRELAGKDLACWCPLDQPCHADVLLELANGETR